MMATWLITGANRGIGLEYVKQLVAAGETVIATVRNKATADGLEEFASGHKSVSVETLDLEDRSSIVALGERLAGLALDVLVNNAGLYGGSWDNSAHRQSHDNMDYGLWEQIMRVNVMAPFQMVQCLRDSLIAGDRKLVVNMSSDLGSIANNTQGQSYAYRSSKAALNMVTKGLSVELGSQGFTIVSMAPGWTQTDLGGSSAQWPVEESVANQLRVISGLSPKDNGRFVDLLNRTVSW